MKDFKDIPIIINNFNRLTTLKKLIHSFEKRGYTNLIILDNKSDYKPLLDFYDRTNYKVYRLRRNIGSKALWKSGVFLKYMFSNFCYTDSDLEIVEECPDDFMEVFYTILKKYKEVYKVGFSLKIDDLPDHYDRKDEVINWESRYYENEKETNYYIAPIDTTFALYRPFSKRGKRDGSVEMIRVGKPYQMRHLPWYRDSKNLSEEELYYKSSKKPTHWN